MKRGLGIVLSGGGTRGIAHIGVLRALTEHGIEAEAIAGTSSGALVGALYAAGYGHEEMLRFFFDKNPFRFSKLAVGKPGWIDTEKVHADFLEYFPEDTFESLGKPLFVTATDLLNGELEIFESGPLIMPLLASCSAPPVFTPTMINGRRYSDGGITNNFPIEPLKDRCERIIGVYTSPLGVADPAWLKTSVGVWQRAVRVGMNFASKAKFDQCDLVICPEALTSYSLFGTKNFEAICQVGYESALEQMDSIERALEPTE